MINVGYNYGRKDQCPLCKIGENDQQHLFQCIVLKLAIPELFHNANNVTYEDVFSQNFQKLIEVAKLCEIITRKRDELIAKL